MLKIRTFLVPVVLVLILTPVFRIATAGAEVVSNPSNDPASVIGSKGGSANQFEVFGYAYCCPKNQLDGFGIITPEV